MADPHVPVPPPAQRSVITRNGDHHKKNCAGWTGEKTPYPGNAHHILPVTCFNPIKLTNTADRHYVLRCIYVSKWDINGGNRFHQAAPNNMVRLPLKSAYFNAYPTKPGNPFRRANFPVNTPMHNSRFSEHYLYNKEVAQYLDEQIWKNLKENKAKHQGKGKDILTELKAAEAHFRSELIRRGNRPPGTLKAWDKRNTHPDSWWLPFSMATKDPGSPYSSEAA